MSLIHTCYRITNVDRSVAFYSALGKETELAAAKKLGVKLLM